MSKIQEALRRIQATSAKTQKKRTDEVQGTLRPKPVRVATVVEHDPGYQISEVDFAANGRTLVFDQKALRDAGLIAPDYHVDLLAKQYRSIKRPLIGHAFGKRATKIEDGNLIMVTSALAGEGKTFTSINLALSMAQERDHSVILVDADVAKPHVSDIFGVSEEPGLLDVLDDSKMDLGSLIMATDVKGLFLLPAGVPRLHATELLASSRMDKVTAALSSITSEPIIIFDSPPLLQTSEASVVASLVGQIVLVVRAGFTSHDAVMTALSTLGHERAVNLVLNQVRENQNEHSYGYGYGYGQGHGQTQNINAPTEIIAGSE